MPELLVEPVALLPVALLPVEQPWPVVVPQPVGLLLVEPPWLVVEPQPVGLPVNSVLAECHLLKLET